MGKNTHIATNLCKHPDIIPVLKEQDLLPRLEWEKESAKCVSVKEAFTQLNETIDTFYADRR